MRDRQKQEDSQDEFEELKEEMETLKQRKMDSPPKNNIKNHPRIQYMAEKHKLGFIPNKHTPQPQLQTHQRKDKPNNIGKVIRIGSVTFRSNFQSGSLGAVELVGSNSFRILLDNQTNSSRGNAWFDFIVEGLKGEASFAIAGFRKKTSLYNEGMKMCYREVGKNSKWKRGGTQVCYLKDMDEEQKDLRRFDIKFNFNFRDLSTNGVQFAYCFPYGFSKLQQLLSFLHSKVKIQTLASSFQGGDLPLINLGNLSSKEVIVLSARVHPGQTVSSLMMEGFLKEIVSDTEYARYLRERFLFKIMPMINVDGVRHGNFRFSASGVDLNRRWDSPSEEHYPEIYYLKQMVIREHKLKRVRMYIDMHGHSRKKNVFFYGCCQDSEDIMDSFKPKAFPFLMSKVHEAYNYEDCSFVMQEDKEGTARIALWNQLRIDQIYTLQASFCSSSKGHYLESDYEKIGQKLCEGIALYFYQPSLNPYPHLEKLVNFREVAYNQLKSNVELLKHGNEQNVGSDSQPEKGERVDLSKNRKNLGQNKAQVRIRPRHQSQGFDCRKIQTNKSISKNVQNVQVGQQQLKHKSQADVNQRQSLQVNRVKDLLPLLKPVIKTDYNYRQKTEGRNIRVHMSKGNTVTTNNLALYTDEPFNEQELSKKERKTVTPLQNTQYRRIKNMLEHKNKQKEGRHSPQTLVQGINKKRVDVQVNYKGVVPRFYANTPFKHKRSSLEVFYNKPNKSVPKASKEGNVFCRGRQIKF